MRGSITQFLSQLARRGSWMGGGSATALSAAVAAALLQKLVQNRRTSRRLEDIRQECVELVEADAAVFARVIRATRSRRPEVFRRSLKQAIEIPYRVFVHAHTLQAMCRSAQRRIRPQFQSDLRCAQALAHAAAVAARGFMATNLAWLRDPDYTMTMRRRLRAATRSHGRRRA